MLQNSKFILMINLQSMTVHAIFHISYSNIITIYQTALLQENTLIKFYAASILLNSLGQYTLYKYLINIHLISLS